jgi:hypothetical protein
VLLHGQRPEIGGAGVHARHDRTRLLRLPEGQPLGVAQRREPLLIGAPDPGAAQQHRRLERAFREPYRLIQHHGAHRVRRALPAERVDPGVGFEDQLAQTFELQPPQLVESVHA